MPFNKEIKPNLIYKQKTIHVFVCMCMYVCARMCECVCMLSFSVYICLDALQQEHMRIFTMLSNK